MYKYQLLYVYINSYQSGGFMWYAVFDRSMLALLCGNFTLLCYFAIRETYLSGPFYAILPLPIIICLFWRHCNETFKIPAQVNLLLILFIISLLNYMVYRVFHSNKPKNLTENIKIIISILKFSFLLPYFANPLLQKGI